MDNSLTFIVPAYNVQDYVGTCLRSILEQTVIGIKIVIVNDGSTDEFTGKICEEFANSNPDNVKYIYQENRGLGAARNTGLQYADTEWVTFLDSDDWIGHQFYEVFLETLERYKGEIFDMIFTLPTIYDSVSGNYKDWNDKELFHELFGDSDGNLYPYLDPRIYNLEVSSCRKIYRMNFLRENKFVFPEGVKWEDVFPHYYLLSKAKKCLGISKIGFYYRINTGNQITSSTGKGRLDIIKVFTQLFGYLIQENLSDGVKISAVETLIKFSKWSINESNREVRKELVQKLHVLFRAIPQKYFKLFFKNNRSRRYKIFVAIIKSRLLYPMLYDYYFADCMQKKLRNISRILRVRRR